MSKILYVCYRNHSVAFELENKIQKICKDLNADNISSTPSLVYRENHIIYGISNPTSTIRTKGPNALLGKIFGHENNWEKSGEELPDGNYAIFRAYEDQVQFMTDCLSTRSIWYYFDEEVFIGSTSQKAIIKYLDGFQFDEGLIPWMLSTGSLGPNHSWDKRIKKVPGDGSVSVDIKNWTISSRIGKVEFVPATATSKQSEELLKKAILETFGSINLRLDKWAVTLSGGHDSRAIAFLLQKCKTYKSPLKTITWGAENSFTDSRSDAYIAEKVSEVLETNHKFFSTDLPEVPLETIIYRFIQNGEGRIDHIPAYLDGFKLWKSIFETGIEGIIRGDEIFGYNQIYSPLVVKSFMGLTLCSDYSNLKKYEYVNSLKQEMPEALKQTSYESLSTWRDRIFQLYRIPHIQSALADIKYSYIEQINPFLSKRIVNVVRTLPDNLRTNKRLFKKVMKKWDLGVPFAQRASTLKFSNILRQEDFVELLKSELSSDYAKKIFPKTFLNEVIKNIKTEKRIETQQKRGVVNNIKSLIPYKFKAYIAQKRLSLYLDENRLAFRIFIICRMHKDLSS